MNNNQIVIPTRLPWIDNCKALAICFVVFFHESQFWNWGGDVVMPVMHRITASFIMPLFVILSGYCGLRSLRNNINVKELWAYNLKNFKRIYLPSLCVGLILFFLRFEQFSTIKGIIGGNWFLTMLFALTFFSSILWIVSYRISQKYVFEIFIPLTFVTLIFIDAVHIGEMVPYYLLGLILKRTDAINKLFKSKCLVSVLLLFTVVLFILVEATGIYVNKLGTFYHFNFSYFLYNGTLYLWLLRLTLCIFVSISIISLFFTFSKSYSFFSWIGSQTLSIYLFSSIPMYIWYSRETTPMLLNEKMYEFICSHVATLYLANTLVFALTITACLLLTYILGKWKYTRLLFLGKD